MIDELNRCIRFSYNSVTCFNVYINVLLVSPHLGKVFNLFLLIFRGSLKSPWSRKRRKHALLPKQWKRFFALDGRLSDGGGKFLKKVRSGVCHWFFSDLIICSFVKF